MTEQEKERIQKLIEKIKKQNEWKDKIREQIHKEEYYNRNV